MGINSGLRGHVTGAQGFGRAPSEKDRITLLTTGFWCKHLLRMLYGQHWRILGEETFLAGTVSLLEKPAC